jgi:hypothetical protein
MPTSCSRPRGHRADARHGHPLVGVTATDPVDLASMAVMFALVATFAAWILARRAAQSERRFQGCIAATDVDE